MKDFLTKEILTEEHYKLLSEDELCDDFPTGKPHFSYSEIANWMECAYRHKLIYVDGMTTWEDNPYADFGTAIHEACENYINTRKMKHAIFEEKWQELWDKNFKVWKPHTITHLMSQHKCKEEDLLETMMDAGRRMLNDVPGFLDKNFPGWEPVRGEEILYEQVPNSKMRVKGYIDAVIKYTKKGKRTDKEYYVLLDWKTTGWGWRMEQKRSFSKQLQLFFYKVYWAQKHDVDLRSVKCAFALIKRTGKDGNRCELVEVSVGPKSVEKTNKKIKDFLFAIRKNFAPKNKSACRYCSFAKTEHCP